MDIERALEIKKYSKQIASLQQKIAMLAIEKYGTIEAEPELLLKRFDVLADLVPVFLETPLGQHGRQSPQLSADKEGGPPYVKVSIYTPSHDSLNSAEISALWDMYPSGRKWDQTEHAITTFRPEYVRRDWFAQDKPQFRGYEGEGSEREVENWLAAARSLCRVEESVGAFADLAFSLTPEEAQKKKFSKDFIILLEENLQTT